ncbi:helix-turn-helix domain-containing protein [Pseudoalteromonas luteoviolacea]|uniref:GlxA family transcriptional regulator n=1 Tax=Pseudoalteromonas luteoviolacea TaxID=43657 RepID=UPI001EEDD65D|nr:helix-turn-helix domain-containing protein [Pseudoalteromonas luteoviolacea]MCF6440529.1 helix-turn-helix domain-containing protein [Pseudoalteromonas luteoviolacea]
MKVAMLCQQGVMASALTGIIDVLNVANQVMQTQFYQWQIVSLNDQSVVSSQGLSFKVDCQLKDLQYFDVLIIIGSQYQGDKRLWQECQKLNSYAPLLSEKLKPLTSPTLIAGCCGVAYAAALGLLDKQRITASWWLEAFFNRHFPHLELDTSPIYLCDQKLYTAGAAHSYMYVMLALIKQQVGADTAKKVMSWLAIPEPQLRQTAFMMSSALDAHQDSAVQLVQCHVKKQLSAQFNLKALAELACVSERTLIRRFKSSVGMTPFDYIRLLRLEKTKELLVYSNKHFGDIAQSVGYQDPQALAKQFKRHFGKSVAAFREQLVHI